MNALADNNGKVSADNFDKIMANASAQAKVYVKQTDAAALSTEAFAQSQTVLAKTSNAVVGGLKSIGAGLLSMGLTLVVSAALNAVVKAIYNAATAEKRYREAALDSTTAINEKTQALDDYEAQIKELKTSIDEGNLSENDAYEARKKLISIQDELAEKYGNELNGIDLVNGGLEEQIGLLDEAAKKKENAFLTEKDKDAGTDNKEAIEDAQRKMTQRHVYMGTFGSLSENDFNTIKKYAEDNGLGVNYSQEFSGDYSIKVSFTGDASNAEKVYTDFVNDVTNDSRLDDDTKTVIADKARSLISSAQDITAENEQLAEQAARYQIETTSAYNELYENLKKAQDDYNDAVAKDNDTAIKKALEAKTSAVEAIREAKFNVGYNDYNTELSDYNNDYIKQYMNAQADELESSTKLKAAQIGLNAAIKDGSAALTEYLDITEEDAKNTIDTIKSSVQSLNGLDDLDLVDIGSLENAGTEITAYTKEQVQAYDNMKSAADKLGISMSDLIDILVKAGLVTGESIKYTNEFTSSALTMATAASKAVSSVTSILNSQGTGVNVDTDSYSELIKDNAEYAAALQYSNGTMQLNREMAQQLTEAKVKESESYIKVAYSQNQVKYEKVKNDLSYYTDEVRKSIEADADKLKQFDEEKAALEGQSEAIRDNCRSLQMQYSALMQASSAYQDWLNAQNATESGDMYDSAIEAKKALAAGLKNGKIGTVKWQAASEFLIPDDYEGTAAEYIKKLNRYFKQASDGSDDGSGINNFITDSLKAGLMKQESDGSIKILADKTTEDFAKALKLSPDAVQSIFGEMQEYGWTFDWGSMLGDPITNYKMHLDDIKDQMADLEPNSEAWQVLDARAEELESALDGLYQRSGLDQLADTVQQAKDNGVELSESAQQAADALDSAGRVQNEIDIYKAQEAAKEAEQAFASSGQIADLDNLDAANQKLTELLQKRQQMGEPTDAEIRLYLEEQEVNGKVPSDVIDDMKNAGLIKIETETDDNAAQTITSQYDTMKAHVEQPVTITANATKCITTLDNIINQLNTIDGSHTVSIKVNQTTVKSARTKTYAEQRAGAYGGAFAGGRTLVGELGNELVVNPHSGKWYTVGDNGAEFVNLPKDAIVFDHSKTKKLLDQGFIGGRGVALASGTAMDSGSPGRGSYVGGDGYKVGQDPRVKSTYKATKASTKATKDNSKALEENKKALEKQKTALEKQKTALEKESNKLKIYGQAAIDEIEKREKALNKEKEAQDKVYESQIKELEKRKTALQKANDEEDRAIKLAELQDALEKARANRTVRIYNKNEGFVWRADQQAVSDAQNDLDDQKRQWKNDDILQAVDDEIERINNLKDAYDESIEAQIEDLDNMKEKWNEVISLIGTSWEDYQLGLAAAAHFNDMTLDGMAGDLVGYKDDVLANMKEIGGVTDQIDSITESIEKLEEAISDAKDAASSGGGSGGSDSSASFGADTGADVEADSDLSQDTQDLLDKLEELRDVYSGLGKDTDDLSEKQRGLVDTIANLTEGTKAHFNAVDELGTVQQTTADKQALMRDVFSEYMTTLSQCTDLTAEQSAELTQAMDDIVNSYSGGYDTIDKLIQGYNDTLIESGDMTNESYQQQLENLLEFADQNQASYDTIAEILNSNFEAVAENTDLTYWQRQSQITSLVDLANQYGVSSDDIINHLANIATQEQYAAESTDITHAAMMTTVQMACVEMGASYDSLRTKIESVTQAQQKMIEAIGKADFNTLMPMGTATSHGNKIQWGKPNFDPLQHATGVLNSPATHIAITDEKGPEIKMRKPSFGQYSLIEKGSSVIPAQPSANLWKFGLDPESFIASHMNQRSIKSVEITQPNMSSAPVVNVGDIQMYGVNDVESFGRVIHDRVSGIFAQEFSKR